MIQLVFGEIFSIQNYPKGTTKQTTKKSMEPKLNVKKSCLILEGTQTSCSMRRSGYHYLSREFLALLTGAQRAPCTSGNSSLGHTWDHVCQIIPQHQGTVIAEKSLCSWLKAAPLGC